MSKRKLNEFLSDASHTIHNFSTEPLKWEKATPKRDVIELLEDRNRPNTLDFPQAVFQQAQRD